MKTVDKIAKLCAMEKIKPSKMMSDIGLTRAAYSAWKNGKQNASESSLALIADYYDIEPSLLADDDKDTIVFESLVQESRRRKEEAILNVWRSASRQQQRLILSSALNIVDNT